MPVATSSAGDGGGSDGSALDSSRPGEHDDAMFSPDDRPGPGQSPSPNARAPQVPDPEFQTIQYQVVTLMKMIFDKYAQTLSEG